MLKKIVAQFVVLVACVSSFAFAADLDKEQAAVKTAEAWVTLIDNVKYLESWSEAAELFKKAVTQEQWQQSLTAVRDPLGKMVVRKIKGTQYLTSMPGAPDGEYVVIQFDTSFENKKEVIETITSMVDQDGIWRIAGYYIK